MIERAAQHVLAGGVVVFPTETFYGLAADPTQAGAMARLRALKGRDASKPIALIAADVATARRTIRIPPILEPACAAFWPGPLTLVVGGTGLRVSGHPVARALARLAGGLITATSANLAGEPAVVAVSELHENVCRGVDFIIDAGRLVGGLASTIIAVETDGSLRLLRPGAIDVAAVEAVIRAEVRR